MDWRHRAACLDEDPELFFPIGNTGPALLQIDEAKAVCRRCPVVDTCLKWAHRDRSGRRRLGRPLRGRAPRAQAPHRPPAPRRLTSPTPPLDPTAPSAHRAAGADAVVRDRAVAAAVDGAPSTTASDQRRRVPRSAQPRLDDDRGPAALAARPLDGPAQLVASPASRRSASRARCRRRARPAARRRRRRPRPAGRRPRRSHDDLDRPRLAPLEPVLDRVGHQLGEDERERGRVLGGDRARTSRAPACARARPRSRRPPPAAGCGRRGRRTAPLSSSVCDRVSCTSAIVATRRIASPSASLASGEAHAPRLQPQQGRHRLQVVLHAVVDLADRRVLGDELALAAAQLGDVAAQQHRTDPLAVLGQRHRAQRQRDPARLDVDAPRRAPHEHQRHRLVDGVVLLDAGRSSPRPASARRGRRARRAGGSRTARWGSRRAPRPRS